jgi:hypothetical protein
MNAKSYLSKHTVGTSFAGVPVESQAWNRAGKKLWTDRRLQSVGYTIYWKDEITPAAIWWDIGTDVASWVPTKHLKARIAYHIQRIYMKGGEPKWPPSKKMSAAGRTLRAGRAKPAVFRRGERTMKQTGALERQVLGMSTHPAFRITATPNPQLLDTFGGSSSFYGKGSRRITMSGLAEAFESPENASYVWFHEMGAGVPRRDFILKGVQHGWNDAINVYNYGLRKSRKIGRQQARARAKTRRIVSAGGGGGGMRMGTGLMAHGPGMALPVDAQMQAYIPQERLTAFAMLWWLLPPSQLWALLGGMSDVAAVISGELLQSRYLGPWLQALALGKLSTYIRVPLTKKYARRGARRRMYRGRGKYRRK